MKRKLTVPHLWVIAAIMVCGAALYYADYIPVLRSILAEAPIRVARYSTHRILSLVQVAYASYIFGRRAGLVTTLIISLALLPQALFVYQTQPEAVVEIFAFSVVALLVTWLIHKLREASSRLKINQSELDKSLQTITRQQRRLASLYRISTVVYKTLDADEIANETLTEVLKGTTAQGGWIYLTSEGSNELTRAACMGPVPDYVIGLPRIRLGEHPDGRVAKSGTPLCTPAGTTEFNKEFAGLNKIDSVFIVPLATRSGILGSMGTAMLGPTADAFDILIATGREIGITLEYSRLHQKERIINERLRLSEERYRGLFENASEAIFICSSTGRVIVANRACEQLTGYTQAELGVMPLEERFHGEDMKKVRALLSRKQPMEDNELCLIKKAGTKVFVKLKYSPLVEDNVVIGLQLIALDVTEERQLRQNMQYYISQVTKAVEEERLRISRELHDDTAQVLASLSRELDSLILKEKGLPKAAIGRLQKIADASHLALREVRRFSQDLRPSILDDLGLVPAIELIGGELEKHGIKTEISITGHRRRPPPDTELAVFRIAQEALSNVRKHAQATTVKMIVDFDSEALTLVITDNGRGFEVPQRAGDLVSTNKLGIIGMRERARLLGGKLVVNSVKGAGTTVTVRIPNSVSNVV